MLAADFLGHARVGGDGNVGVTEGVKSEIVKGFHGASRSYVSKFDFRLPHQIPKRERETGGATRAFAYKRGKHGGLADSPAWREPVEQLGQDRRLAFVGFPVATLFCGPEGRGGYMATGEQRV